MRHDPRHGAHIRADIVSAHFAASLNQHNPEELVACVVFACVVFACVVFTCIVFASVVFAEAVGHHLSIARFKYMQRQNLPWE